MKDKKTKKSKDIFFCSHFKEVYVIGDCRNCDKFEHEYKLFGKCKYYNTIKSKS